MGNPVLEPRHTLGGRPDAKPPSLQSSSLNREPYVAIILGSQPPKPAHPCIPGATLPSFSILGCGRRVSEGGHRARATSHTTKAEMQSEDVAVAILLKTSELYNVIKSDKPVARWGMARSSAAFPAENRHSSRMKIRAFNFRHSG